MTRTPRETAETYFRAWNDADAETLREVLSPDVVFAGPMGPVAGLDACVEGLLAMREGFLDEVVVDTVLAEGDEVLTWYEMRTRLPGVAPFPVVNRMHVGPDGADLVRAVFDPRPLLG